MRTRIGTFGRFQPFLFDAVADLSFRLTLWEVTHDDGRVAFIDFYLLLDVGLEVPQLCKSKENEENCQKATQQLIFSSLMHQVNLIYLHKYTGRVQF